MIDTLLVLTVVVLAAVSIGELVCRLAGWPPWSWLSGAVGIATMIVIAGAASDLPGHAATGLVAIAAVAVAAAVVLLRPRRSRGDRRPTLRGVLDPALCGLVVFALTLVPFIGNGRFGLLGLSFNNDTRFHLWAAEYLAAGQTVPDFVFGSGYPLGSHALVASLAAGLGVGVEPALVGLLMAIPVLTAWTARAALTELSRPRAALVAVLVGTTYLLASYYAQAAYKETLEALFALAFALALRDLIRQRRLSPRAALVPALLTAGALLTYSYPGAAWLLATLGLTAVGLLVVRGPRAALAAWRDVAATAAVGGLVALVAVAPEIGRIFSFFHHLSLSAAGTGVIPTSDIGNLIHPLSPFEALGAWATEDFRFAPGDAFHGGMLAAVSLGVAIFGLVWWLRRGELALTAGALAATAIYVVLRSGESAYIAAKALVVLSPFVMLLGASALLARAPRLAPEVAVVRGLVAVVFVGAVGWSTLLTLRNAQVDPDTTGAELSQLQPLVTGHTVLFLGNDGYIGWRLFGANVTNPPQQSPLPYELRPQKPFQTGQSLDFDSVQRRTLDRFTYTIVPRTAFASAPPPNFTLVRETRSFQVWRRQGPTPPLRVLREGEAPGAVLDCEHPADRRIASRSGTALVRPAPVAVPGPPGAGAGYTVAAPLRLPSAGTWQLSLQYASPQRLSIATAPGALRTTLPPTLDPVGPFWPVGRLQTRGPRSLLVRVTVHRAAPQLFTARSQYAVFGRLAAVRTDRPPRRVALREACGRYVDHYTTRGVRRRPSHGARMPAVAAAAVPAPATTERTRRPR